MEPSRDVSNGNGGALEGVKVVEMGIWVAGPAAAAVLGDWGADVVKIEHPEGGDPARALLAMGVVPYEPEINPPLELDNRNKRSVTVDVRTAEGRDVVLRLLRDADVFVTNFRAAALRRLGLAYADVRRENPRLIYAALSGYGTRGPERDRAAFDYAAFWARAGAMASLGEPAGPPPTQRPAMGDHPAGLCLAGAVAAALFRRERSGEGQEVHLSLYQAGLWMMATDIQVSLLTGLSTKPTGRAVPNPLWNHYQTSDDRWLHLVMLQADRYWERFCKAIGRTDLAGDERYASVVSRAQHSAELIELFDGIFATRTLDEWAEVMDHFELVWAPVQSVGQVVQDPQARALDAFEKIEHRSGHTIEIVKSPVEFGTTPATIRRGAPELGEHTEEVLLEMGYTWEQIADLKEKRAIG